MADLPKKKKKSTSLTDQLTAGEENLTGYSMDDVKVHYDSSKPAQLDADAFDQGNQIEIDPENLKHLPHEAWHVVQQNHKNIENVEDSDTQEEFEE